MGFSSFVLLLLTAIASVCPASAFVPHVRPTQVEVMQRNNFLVSSRGRESSVSSHSRPSSALHLSNDDDGGGIKAIATGAVGILVAALFVSTSLFPMMGSGGGSNAPMSQSIATPNDAVTLSGNDQYRLSRAAIQEKLNTVPVFYITSKDVKLVDTKFYLSSSMAEKSAGGTLKVTTLDQVEYPLIQRRGRMRMAPPPSEIQQAEEASDTKYSLISSSGASAQVPLYIADRLAFANPGGGLQLPMFLEKSDCIESYKRLRGDNKNLPEEPTVRSTTLEDQLLAMEKGLRPGMSQIKFYPSADDAYMAVSLMETAK